MTPSQSGEVSHHHGRGVRGPCTNDHEWELAKDRELDEMTDDQIAYLVAAAEVTLDDRGFIRDGNGWRLDV